LGDLPAVESVGIWGWLAIIAGIGGWRTALGLGGLQSWARVGCDDRSRGIPASSKAVLAFFLLLPVPWLGCRVSRWAC
jgi:hypothetical protein